MPPIFDNPDFNKSSEMNNLGAPEVEVADKLNLEHLQLTRPVTTGGANSEQITKVHPLSPGESQSIEEFMLPGNWSSLGPFPTDGGIINYTYELQGVTQGTGDVGVIYKYIMHGAAATPQEKVDTLNIMSKPDHKLSAAEINNITGKKIPGTPFFAKDAIEALQDTLEDDPDDFNIRSAWTQTIHGKRMLFVEGDYLKGGDKGYSQISAYVDSDPNRLGRLPESTSLVVKTLDYQKYYPLFMQTIESIRWRQPTHASE